MKYFIHLPMKMEPIVSSETSAIRTQTPGNYPKRNKLHLEHGESLKTQIDATYCFIILMIGSIYRVIQNDCRGFNNLSYKIHLKYEYIYVFFI